MDKARLIIPFWGEEYLERVLDFTLPALLAAGNLPTFTKSFDLEVRLVTELRFSRAIWSAPAIRHLAKIADIQIVAIDDLLTYTPGHYGVTLTYAYWLGFRDLGPNMIGRNLLFLNADFIVADGSYSYLAKRLKSGDRIVLSPSFRTCSEDLIPILKDKRDSENAGISLDSRSMVALALRFKHPTVVARTINQEAFHLECMDQYYWYVDAYTMICYQHPAALIAARPQRELLEPTLMCDFSFVPDLCPHAQMSIIDDSDHFFMVELQAKQTGSDLVRPGWLSRDEMVKLLGGWSCEWQRVCGQHMLTFHARDLPSNFERVCKESHVFMADIAQRLKRFPPNSHLNHPFSAWFKSVAQSFFWKHQTPPSSLLGCKKATGLKGIALTDMPLGPQSTDGMRVGIKAKVWNIAAAIYDRVIGRIPYVRRTHPLWHEMQTVLNRLSQLARGNKEEVLFVVVGRSELFRYYRMAGIQPKIVPIDKRSREAPIEEGSQPVIKFCFIEMDAMCMSELRRLCEKLYPHLLPEGEFLVYIHNHDGQVIAQHDIGFLHNSFPDFGVTHVRWFGNAEYARMLKSFRMPEKAGVISLIWHAVEALTTAIKVSYINSTLSNIGSEVFDPNFTAALVETKMRPSDEAR